MNCDPTKTPCYAVTRAFVDEHRQLLNENIRLKKSLKDCAATP